MAMTAAEREHAIDTLIENTYDEVKCNDPEGGWNFIADCLRYGWKGWETFSDDELQAAVRDSNVLRLARHAGNN